LRWGPVFIFHKKAKEKKKKKYTANEALKAAIDAMVSWVLSVRFFVLFLDFFVFF